MTDGGETDAGLPEIVEGPIVQNAKFCQTDAACNGGQVCVMNACAVPGTTRPIGTFCTTSDGSEDFGDVMFPNTTPPKKAFWLWICSAEPEEPPKFAHGGTTNPFNLKLTGGSMAVSWAFSFGGLIPPGDVAMIEVTFRPIQLVTTAFTNELQTPDGNTLITFTGTYVVPP